MSALLELLDVRGGGSLDAMHGQTKTAKAIRDAGADYLLAIKKNQKSLYEDVKLFFEDAIEHNDTHVLMHTMEPDNGHGRLDERTVWATSEVRSVGFIGVTRISKT